jgi:exosortase
LRYQSSAISGRTVTWLLGCAGAALLFLRPLLELAQLSLADQHYSHIGLVPLIFLYLVWDKREALSESPRSGHLAGVAFALLALVPIGWSTAFRSELAPGESLSLTILSFVLLLWGVFVWCFGQVGARVGAFSLFMLLFLVPLPAAWLEVIVQALLWGSAWVTDGLFRLTGIPFFRQHDIFVLPGLTIQVAEECSGIRSTMALTITGLLAGYFTLRSGWSRVALVGALFPLAVFKNGLRIVTLSYLAIHVDMGFMTGNLHRRGGIVFFLVTLTIMAIFIKFLRIVEEWATRGRHPAT